jgi:hypothetical protein
VFVRTWALVVLMLISSPGGCVDFRTFQRGDEEVTLLVGRGTNHRIPESNKDRFHFNSLKLRYGWFTSPKGQAIADAEYTWTNDASWRSGIAVTVGGRRFLWQGDNDSFSVEGHIGLARMMGRASELGTRTNFVEELGLIYEFSVGDSSAMSIEYRFSHVSNAGIKLPNVGINASLFSVGYSWYK